MIGIIGSSHAWGQQTQDYIPNQNVDNNSHDAQLVFDDRTDENTDENTGAGNLPRLRAIPDSDSTGRNPRRLPATPVSIISADGSVTPLANSRVEAEQGGTRRSDDPFAPLGIRMGSFTLFPVLTQSIGTTSNADSSAGGSPSTFSQTDIRLRGLSNWPLHELRGEVGGNYETFFNGASDDVPVLDANLQLRLDLSRSWTARFGVNGNISTESAVSDNITVPFPLFIDGRPVVSRYGGFAEIEKQVGRLNGRLRGTITRTDYENAKVSNGTILSQQDRANTLFELSGRLAYETSAVFQPFVEATLGTRQFSARVDRNGNERDSVLFALRGGLEFNRGEKLNGQLSLGYSTEVFADNALDSLSGLTIDGAINWSPLRFTTITATAQTQFSGSTNVNEAGSITYAGSLGIRRDLRVNLSLNARILASLRTYDGSGREDQTLQGLIGAEWRLNRNVALFGNVGYETVDSTDVGSSYNATTARIGLRLQR